MSRYQVGRLLGAGGMGRVHEATRVFPGDIAVPCAIKRIRATLQADADVVRRFKEEARILSSLAAHTNIVTLRDFDRSSDGELFMALERVSGPSLEEIAQASAPLPAYVVRRVLYDVADALGHIHFHKVAHRDVSPRNLLVSGSGDVKLVDFGLACPLGVSSPGAFEGTAAYASPEALHGAMPTAGMDLYSLGAVGYQLLAGSSPFGHGNAAVIKRRMRRWRIPPLPAGTPVDLREVIGRLLDPEAGARYASADDVLAALRGHARPFARQGAMQRLAARHVPLEARSGPALRESLDSPVVLEVGDAPAHGRMHGAVSAARAARRRAWLLVGAFALVGAAVLCTSVLSGPPWFTAPTTTDEPGAVEVSAAGAPPVAVSAAEASAACPGAQSAAVEVSAAGAPPVAVSAVEASAAGGQPRAVEASAVGAPLVAVSATGAPPVPRPARSAHPAGARHAGPELRRDRMAARRTGDATKPRDVGPVGALPGLPASRARQYVP